jgi:NAD(P)-dependent dehydrogenase (short-subunit alcohol dehydrogenase family)
MADDIRFDGRVILVTGAGSGMGRTHALLLASRGAQVVVADYGVTMSGTDPGPGPAQAVVAEITQAGGQAVAYLADLATEAGSAGAVQAAIDAYGRLDGLVHSATTVPELTPVDQLSSHDLEVVMRINVFAGLWLARAAWPHMVAQRYGRILFKTSVGIFGGEGTTSYCAAKAAKIGMMRCLALEGAPHGILVNVIAPSARTRQTEHFLKSAYAEWLWRTMPPEKVSVAAAYLLSEDCDVTGEVISLGGGRIGRLVLGESHGVMRPGETIEEVRDALPQVLAETDFFYPHSTAERSTTVAAMFGFHG